MAQLSAGDFSAREQAAQALLQAGERAIEPLKAVFATGNPEATWRAAATLGQIAVDGDDQVFASAAGALASASLGPNASEHIEDLRTRHAARQRVRAEASIRALGGLFGLLAEQRASLLDPPQAAAPAITAELDEALSALPNQPTADPAALAPPALPAPPPDISAAELAALLRADALPPAPAAAIEPLQAMAIADAYVSPDLLPESEAEIDRALTLDQAWRGGDDGLADLRHLPDVVSVRLEAAPVSDAALKYISVLPRLRDMRISRSPFTPAALGRFRQRHPNVTVFVNGQSSR